MLSFGRVIIRLSLAGGGQIVIDFMFEMNDDEFAKVLFYRGIDTFMSQMTDMINNMSDEEKAKAFTDAGVEVPEELKEPTREELAALGKMDSDTSTEEDA